MRKLLLFLLSAVLVLCVACAPDTASKGNKEKTEPIPATTSLTVYKVNDNYDKLVKSVVEVKLDKDKPTLAVQELLNAKDDGKTVNLWAKNNVQLLGVTVGEQGVATVNFSKELKKIRGGSAMELLLVYSVVNTLTELPEVKSVRFVVEGKPIATITGHMDLTEPITRDTSILSGIK